MDPANQVKLAETVPLTPEQIAAAQPRAEDIALINRRAADNVVAQSAPLPGPLRDAFAADPQTFLGVTLQPVTATHVACLVRLKNPFLDGLRYGMAAAVSKDDAEKNRLTQLSEALNIQPEDLFEALLVFSMPPSALRNRNLNPNPNPNPTLRESAISLMDRFAPITPDQLSNRLAEHYFDSFKTAVSYEAGSGDAPAAAKKKCTSTSATTASAGS